MRAVRVNSEGRERRVADFRIVSKPTHIAFTCPHCGDDVKIPWGEADAPEYWGDKWPDATCPSCDATVALDDWDYD